MASDPSQNEIDLQAQISSALARRSQRQPAGGDPRIEPTLGLGGMGPGAERAAPRQDSLLDDEPVGEIPPAPIHFKRDGEETHAPRPKPKVDSRIERHRNWLFFLLPVVGIPVVILISLFLYLAIEMQGEGVQDSAPLIAAPEGPDKVKPTNEGGLAVEGMDSALLNQTANGQSQTTTEQLLPPPEEPMTPPAEPQPAPTAMTGDGTAASETSAAPSVEVPLTPPPAAVPTTNEAASTAANSTAATATATAPAASTEPAAPAQPATTRNSDGRQLSRSVGGLEIGRRGQVRLGPVPEEISRPVEGPAADHRQDRSGREWDLLSRAGRAGGRPGGSRGSLRQARPAWPGLHGGQAVRRRGQLAAARNVA